jgi:hypothetical protein
MREGKAVIVDEKIKHDLPSLKDILPNDDDGDDEGYSTRYSHEFWDERYKSTFVHDNDEPDNESFDLNTTIEYTKSSPLITENFPCDDYEKRKENLLLFSKFVLIDSMLTCFQKKI